MATSERLIDLDRDSNVTSRDYKSASDSDQSRIQALEDLRTHNRLLTRYFEFLQILAQTGESAPENAFHSAAGIAGSIVQIGEKVKGSPLVPPDRQTDFKSALSDVFGTIAAFTVSSQIKGALRQELEQRGQTIEQQLALQQKFLEVVISSLEEDISDIVRFREIRLIKLRITDQKLIENGEAETWIEQRQEILMTLRTVRQLKDTKKNLEQFRTTFRDFIEGRSSDSQLASLVADIKSFSDKVGELE